MSEVSGRPSPVASVLRLAEKVTPVAPLGRRFTCYEDQYGSPAPAVPRAGIPLPRGMSRASRADGSDDGYAA